jgi:DNA-binding beta-propeller fold protein YncE
VYVPVQCTTSFCNPNTPGHVVDVIDASKCNAEITAGCKVVARARVGSAPLAAALDPRTGTVYVVNGTSNTVSVINGARCNARVTAGCGRPVATIKVGKFPVAAVINPATRTLYVVSPNGDVFVINAARCNAVTTRGCGLPVKTAKAGAGSQAIDVDVATDTVYTANSGATGNGDTVSVINGAICNGHTSSGCGQAPGIVTVGSGAFWVAVDQASDTVYVANDNDGTISVINGATCNATVTSGCHNTPPTVTTGANPQFVAVDHELHTVFAANQGDNTLSAVDTRTCNGTMTSGCHQQPPAQRATAPDQGPRYNPGPNAFALIPQTGTAYVVNVGGTNILSVTSISRCNATDITGCRHPAPAVPDPEFLLSVDPATNTIYGGNNSQPVIDVINGATCNTRDLSGCAPVATIPMAHPQANMAVDSIDQATHTLYAADPFSDTVAVINTATCNATHTAGCAATPPTIKVGVNPGPPALNPATRSLYVPFGDLFNKVAVINTATCNATDTAGCGQAPGAVTVGQGTFYAAVSPKTNTIYAPSTAGNTVAVINGATCNGTDHSGCRHLAATAQAGIFPYAVAVNDRTHTVYVTNFANGDLPGTISIINGATCNGTHTSGCHQRFPVLPTGRGPISVAVDPNTGTIYVADLFSAAATILNGSRCDAADTSGCGKAGRQQAVGSLPQVVIVNPRTSTVYFTQAFQAGSMSIFKATRR